METQSVNVAAPDAETGATRRSFHVRAIYAMWSIIAAALGGAASTYLLLAPKARKNEEWIDIGDVAKLATDQPVEMVFHRNRADAWNMVSEKATAWVVKTADKSVVAFGPQCTHLGCPHHWEGERNQFVCPCHNSLFTIDGEILAGPAPRPLDRYDLKIEGNRLLLGGLRHYAKRS